jgi:hypothetical protein
MSRLGCWAAICLLAGLASGCSICSSDYDCDYGMYGGSWERHHPSRGRVGSAFEPAGSPVLPTAAESPAEPVEAPAKPLPSDETLEPMPRDEMDLPDPSAPS